MADVANLIAPRYNTDRSGENFAPKNKEPLAKKDEMQSIYRRIRPCKVTEEIVGQIKSLIKDGTLHPGEQLPSERILCGLLGVGRSSIREACVLEALGFQVKNRKGVFAAR
jgi:DNA-binding GntR family transcriptional regulator